MHEPKTTRYAAASQARGATLAGWNRAPSPASKPTIHNTAPPHRACIPAPSSGELGSEPCLEYSEPQDHDSEANTSTEAPTGFTRPEFPKCAGPTKIKSPAKPIT